MIGGLAELRRACHPGFLSILGMVVFSATVNVLMLTGPLFMLQVYDRVLSSHSVETLTALFLLVVFLFLLMGVIDLARNLAMMRIATRFQQRMEPRVFSAILRDGGGTSVTAGGLHDLDAVHRFVASPVLLALLDLPWAPLFLAAVYIFHPLLGLVATLGAVVLALTAIANRFFSRVSLQRAQVAAAQARRMANLYRDEGETICALGMRSATFTRWRQFREEERLSTMKGAGVTVGFSVFSRSFRLLLQSALLATGALLVLRAQVTPGAMIASSVMMARALAPIEQVIGGWSILQAGQDGWKRLANLLTRQPPRRRPTPLPRPEGRVQVRQLTVTPPDMARPTLHEVNFELAPGEALGVIGASGSGKSTLARALTGIWTPCLGSIRLGGVSLDQFHPDVLGGLIGFLPQQVTLFDGTIADNIARLAPDPDPERVVRAARGAAVHQMILDLPQGYDTRLNQTCKRLSGGQIQRIGLARALYSDPILMVLDEPNSNLDNIGAEALNRAIRTIKQRQGTVIIMAHRPTALNECERLMVLESGRCRTIGPRDVVMKEVLRNAAPMLDTRKSGGRGV